MNGRTGSARIHRLVAVGLAFALLAGLAALAAAQGMMGQGMGRGMGQGMGRGMGQGMGRGMSEGMMQSPVEPTEASLAQGRELFATYCAACHGESGRGDGPAAEGMEPPPANLRALAGTRPDQYFFTIISGSRQHMMRPAPDVQSQMPDFSESLSETERWHLVNHIQHGLGR